MGRKRARMRALEDQVVTLREARHARRFFLGVAAPQDESGRQIRLRDRCNSRIGNRVPARARVTARLVCLDSQRIVEAHKAGSHAGKGWDAITDAVVAAVAQSDRPTAFILWGSHAQKKARRITGLPDGPHLVLRSPHPSPLSAHRGFFGSRPFSQVNAFLEAQGRGAIDWSL